MAKAKKKNPFPSPVLPGEYTPNPRIGAPGGTKSGTTKTPKTRTLAQMRQAWLSGDRNFTSEEASRAIPQLARNMVKYGTERSRMGNNARRRYDRRMDQQRHPNSIKAGSLSSALKTQRRAVSSALYRKSRKLRKAR